MSKVPNYGTNASESSLQKTNGLLDSPPSTIRAYLDLIRWFKPTGTVLMFWPFAWGLTLACFRTPLPLQQYMFALAACLIGAFIVRSSACTINDIFDREFDAAVERTRSRPLPSGRVSVRGATIYLIIQYIVGLLYFSLLDKVAFYAAMIQLLPLFAIYPLLKRYTYWPQAWLGIAMNFGLVVAFAQVTGFVDYSLLSVLLAAGWCWTMLYDTIYACQDKKDDPGAGVKSTALLFGRHIHKMLYLVAFGFVAMLLLGGILNDQRWPYFVISVGGTALHVLWQFYTVDLDIPESCWTNFKRNGQLGWIVWGGLFVDYLAKINGIPLNDPLKWF